jgi:hypothetical protein
MANSWFEFVKFGSRLCDWLVTDVVISPGEFCGNALKNSRRHLSHAFHHTSSQLSCIVHPVTCAVEKQTLRKLRNSKATNAVHPLSFVRVLSVVHLSFLILDRLCGLVVRVLGYRSGDPDSIPGTTIKKVVGLERFPLSLLSTNEELLDRKVAAPV